MSGKNVLSLVVCINGALAAGAAFGISYGLSKATGMEGEL